MSVGEGMLVLKYVLSFNRKEKQKRKKERKKKELEKNERMSD